MPEIWGSVSGVAEESCLVASDAVSFSRRRCTLPRVFDPEDEGIRIFRNGGYYLSNNAALEFSDTESLLNALSYYTASRCYAFQPPVRWTVYVQAMLPLPGTVPSTAHARTLGTNTSRGRRVANDQRTRAALCSTTHAANIASVRHVSLGKERGSGRGLFLGSQDTRCSE